MLLILPLLFLSQSSSLLTSMQSSSEVPSAAELVSAIEKLVKTKMVSVFAGLCTHSCGPRTKITVYDCTCMENFSFCLFFIAKVKPNTFELKRPLTSIIFLCWWIFVFMLICIILKWVWVQLSDFSSEIKLSLSTAKHRNKILPVRKLRFHTISFASV